MKMYSTLEYNKFTDEYFVVVPDDVVEYLDLLEGDILEWSMSAAGIVVTKKQTS